MVQKTIRNKKKLKLAILGSTRGTSMQPIIDAIDRGILDASVEIVISNKADASILERAKKHGIDALFVDHTGRTREQYDAEVMDILARKQIDLILLIGYMRFLSPRFVEAWRGRIWNVHPSLLPAFAGLMDLAVHEAVLAAGVSETGCTIHAVDEGADTGPIIMQKTCPVDTTDTPETLKARVQQLEGAAFIEAIQTFDHPPRVS